MTPSKSLYCSALAILVLSGCNRAGNKQIEPVYDKQTGKLQVLKYDRDKNGTAETISYMDGSRILRIEIDENEDGTIDRWEHYDADQKLVNIGKSRAGNGKEDSWLYPAADGSLAKIEISAKGDGKITRTEYYDKAVLVRAEEDSDGDGVLDKWDTYSSAGQLASVAFDTSHRGTPDRRLVYGPGGEARVETIP
jgi:hypothetical protein